MFGIHAELGRIATKLGYHFPYPVQRYIANMALENGNFAGLMADGTATKIEVDYQLPPVPSTGHMFSDSVVITKVASCMVSSTEVVVVYRKNTPDLFIVKGTIEEDGVINWGSPQDTGENCTDNKIAITAVGVGAVVFCWNQDATSVYAKAATWDDTVFTFGSSFEISARNAVNLTVASPDPNKVVFFYGEENGKVYSRAAAISEVPPALTFGSEVEITGVEWSTRGGIDLCKVADNKVAFIFIAVNGGIGKVTMRAGTLSDVTIGLGNAVQATHSVDNDMNLQICSTETDKAIGVYCDGVGGIFGYSMTFSGNSITMVSKQLPVDALDVFMAWSGMEDASCFLTSATGEIVAGSLDQNLKFTGRGILYGGFLDVSVSDIAFYPGNDKYVLVYKSATDSFGRGRALQSTLIGQTTWAEDVPKPTVRFLGMVITPAVAEETVSIASQGIHAGYREDLDPFTVFVKGPNAIQSVVTTVRGSTSRPVLAFSHSVNTIEIVPDLNEADFKNKETVSNTLIKTITGNSSEGEWSAWQKVLEAYAEDVNLANVTVKLPTETTMTSFLQIGYGSVSGGISMIAEFPIIQTFISGVGYEPSLVFPFPDLPLIPSNNEIFVRVLNDVVEKNVMVHLRLVG